MDRDDIIRKLTSQFEVIEQLGGEIDEVVVEPPANEAEVGRVESKLGSALPPVMRNSFLTFARGVSLGWSLPDGFQLPEPVERAAWGEINY